MNRAVTPVRHRGDRTRRAPQSCSVLKELQRLPVASVATDQEVLRLIRDRALAGRGIGYVDAHLLAAVRLSAGATLWTRDKRLLNVARELSLASL